MKARIQNISSGTVVEAHSTTDCPASSYNAPVWVDDNNEALFQIDTPNPFFKVLEVEVESQSDIGLYLRFLRLSRGFSMDDLAKRCGFSLNTIQYSEKGKYSTRSDIVITLLNALDSKLVIRGT